MRLLRVASITVLLALLSAPAMAGSSFPWGAPPEVAPLAGFIQSIAQSIATDGPVLIVTIDPAPRPNGWGNMRYIFRDDRLVQVIVDVLDVAAVLDSMQLLYGASLAPPDPFGVMARWELYDETIELRATLDGHELVFTATRLPTVE